MKNTMIACMTAIVLMCTVFAVTGSAADPMGSFVPKTSAVSAPGANRVIYPALVDVGSKQCTPCVLMEPVLKELRADYESQLRVQYIDVERDPETATRLGVRVLPTQIFYDASGKERFRHMGYMSRDDVLKTFERLGVKLKKKGPQARSK